ncbi:MAG: hypothetical protein IPL22_12890 [Bacteroidetes bacterium]|nr:hypothetical protein [Bacteroidota bacterium]
MRNCNVGLPSDDATTGIWTIDVLIPSYVGTGLVQPDVQNTYLQVCFVL